MGWKNRISRFNGKMTKEKWLLLLLIGVLLMILSFPLPGGSRKDKNAVGQTAGAGTEGAGAVPLWTKDIHLRQPGRNIPFNTVTFSFTKKHSHLLKWLLKRQINQQKK